MKIAARKKAIAAGEMVIAFYLFLCLFLFFFLWLIQVIPYNPFRHPTFHGIYGINQSVFIGLLMLLFSLYRKKTSFADELDVGCE